jgi:hypothetical protein
MRRAHGHRLFRAGLALALACGGDNSTPFDAGVADGGLDAGPADGGAASPVVPTVLPRFTPCPPGWREVSRDVGGTLTVCDPWPPSGRAACAGLEVHLPGTAGCAALLDACPADGWPAGLPSGATIVHARAGAVSGDGSRASPFASIDEALAAAPDDAIIAIAVGTYAEPIRVTRPATLWGACADTILTSTSTSGTINADSTRLSLRNLRIAGAEQGVWASDTELELDRIVLEDIAGVGLEIGGGSATGRDVLLRRLGDTAINVARGGALDLERAVIEDVPRDGVRTSASTLFIEGSLLTRLSGEGSQVGFASTSGGITLERSVIADTRGETLLSIDAVTIAMRDVLVSPDPAFDGSTTIANVGGGTIELERVRLEGIVDAALLVADSGTRLVASDVAILTVTPEGGGPFGHAIEIALGADADLTRMLVHDATGLGALIDGTGTIVSASDLTIRDTRPNTSGHLGRAVQVQRGASFSLERGVFDAGREAAFVAAGTLTSAMLSDVVIAGTAEAECAATGCPSAGVGVGVYERAAARLTRFRIRDNALLGAQIASDAQLDLADGEVIGHPVGVNIQVDPYDLDRLTNGVYYRDNGMNLDTRTLPVPDATTTREMP